MQTFSFFSTRTQNPKNSHVKGPSTGSESEKGQLQAFATAGRALSPPCRRGLPSAVLQGVCRLPLLLALLMAPARLPAQMSSLGANLQFQGRGWGS